MKRRSLLVLLMAVAAVLASTAYVWSQLRTRVELVVVPVNVRDAEGKLVTGLMKEDFSVLEDGKSQTISSFSIEPIPLSAAIVLDDGMSGTALKRILPLFEVMTAGFAPEDEMASFRYDHLVWKLSDFTSDPEVIKKSFGEISQIAETRPPQADPNVPLSKGPGWLQSITGMIRIGSNGAPNPIPTGKDRPAQIPTSRLLHDAVFQAANLLRDRSPERRRLIMLISNGQATGQNTQTLEKNVDLLLQSDIQVFVVSMDFPAADGTGALSVYARSTGGDIFGGGSSPEVSAAFARITEQARNQYVLGYYSTNKTNASKGTYREITVKISKPALTINHRKGYTQYPVK